MSSPNIVSLGEVLWDILPSGPRFGGAPANFAAHAAALGGDVTLVSAVGDDARGRDAIQILNDLGVNTDLIQVAPDAPTGTVGVELDQAGKPTFQIHSNAAWDTLDWNDQIGAQIRNADAIYFGTLSQRNARARSTIQRALEVAIAQKANAPRILLDVNLRAPFFDHDLIRESITLANILKLSDDELPQIADACGIEHDQNNQTTTLRVLIDHFDLAAIVLTRGADGALFITSEKSAEHPGLPAQVVDTVGAGDSFTAAFLVGYLRSEPITKTLENACRTAAAVCGQAGAMPVLDRRARQ